MTHRRVNEVASSCDIVLNTRVSDVLKVVIVATHVCSDVVLLQQWLELSHKGISWTMFSN